MLNTVLFFQFFCDTIFFNFSFIFLVWSVVNKMRCLPAFHNRGLKKFWSFYTTRSLEQKILSQKIKLGNCPFGHAHLCYIFGLKKLGHHHYFPQIIFHVLSLIYEFIDLLSTYQYSKI